MILKITNLLRIGVIIFISVCFLWIAIPVGYFGYITLNYENLMANLVNKISDNPKVEKVDILYDNEIFELEMEIIFTNGGRLLLRNVSERLRNFTIVEVGEFKFFQFSQKWGTGGTSLYLDVLNKLLGTKYKTVTDIVNNYDKIYGLVKTFPNYNTIKIENETIRQTFERNSEYFKQQYNKKIDGVLVTYSINGQTPSP